MKKLNILYTLDKAYLKYMLASLYSLAINNKDLDINVHIIYDGFDKSSYELVEAAVNHFNNIDIFFYDFNNIRNIINDYNISTWRGKDIPNARLFFNEVINGVDNILYLDSDTLIAGSLSKLAQYDGTVNMVEDAMPAYYWKELDPTLNKYYNSGVMYINTHEWENNKCEAKIVDVIKNYQEFTYPDQYIINIALRNDISALPPEYNLFSADAYYNPFILSRHYSQNKINRYDYNMMKKAKENPIILHSTPFYYWHGWEENAIHPYNRYYVEYFKALGLDLDDDNGIKRNPTLYKLYLNTKLLFPKEIKDKVKEIIKK